MQNRIKICTILFCWFSASIVFAQNDPADISEKLKILEGHQKNLEESYQNKLDDLTRKFELYKQEADHKCPKAVAGGSEDQGDSWGVIFLIPFPCILTAIKSGIQDVLCRKAAWEYSLGRKPQVI